MNCLLRNEAIDERDDFKRVYYNLQLLHNISEHIYRYTKIQVSLKPAFGVLQNTPCERPAINLTVADDSYLPKDGIQRREMREDI